MTLSMLTLAVVLAAAQAPTTAPTPATVQTPAESTSAVGQDVMKLSRQKWLWMAERKVDALADLSHADAVFVHMGGTMGRDQELQVIQSGGIRARLLGQ